MRRSVFVAVGCLELVIAAVLVALGCQIPSTGDVDAGFRRAHRVSERASDQVRLLQSQVAGLRRLEMRQVMNKLQAQTRTVVANLRQQAVDFETLQAMRDALVDVGTRLDGLGETLDPAIAGKLSAGLGETAAFLDEKVVPAAERAADQLERSTEALRVDARRLATLLRETPLDLQAVREVHQSLGRFREGLDQLDRMLRLQRMEAMREGFQGLENSLVTGAEQVERLSGYTYPVVTINGVRPEVRQKQFWPEGDRIGQGMRKAAAGVSAAGKELDEVAAEFPRLRASLQESGKVIERVRHTLAVALEQQQKLEPVLRDAPAHAARLAEELPRLGQGLAQVLRDTKQLKGIATALRQAQQSIDMALARWPELRTTLDRMAVVLRAAAAQLDHALQHRDQYEAAVQQTVVLADSFVTLLPLVTDQLDSRLDEEEQALEGLGQSLDEVQQGLPVFAQTAVRLVWIGRLLAWLTALIVGLHGCYLVLSARLGRRFSP